MACEIARMSMRKTKARKTNIRQPRPNKFGGDAQGQSYSDWVFQFKDYSVSASQSFSKVLDWAEDSKDLEELSYEKQKFPVAYSEAQEALCSIVVRNLTYESRPSRKTKRIGVDSLYGGPPRSAMSPRMEQMQRQTSGTY